MSPELTQKLFDCAPKLYTGKDLEMSKNLMCFGFDVGNGWFKPLYKLSLAIEKLNNQGDSYVATQVKQKFAGLRFYIDGATDKIDKLIEEAEAECSELCERCGNKGFCRNNRGWTSILCDKCNE